MKQLFTLRHGRRPLGRAAAWLLWLLGLFFTYPAAVRGQSTAPFVVRATPAGPLSLAAGQQVVLAAQAVYPAFVTGTGFNGNVYATLVQGDGKILVGGDFTNYKGTPCNRIARLNPDGSFDTGFSIGAGFDATVWTLALQSNNSILVGGSFTTYGSNSCLRLARLLPTGAFDATLVTSSATAGFDGTVRAIGVLSTGDLVVGGEFNAYGANTSSKYLVRLSSTGVLNTSFASATHTSLNLFNSRVLALVVQSGDNIVVGGSFVAFFTGGRKGIARLSSNGILDTSFASSTGSGPSAGAINTIAEFNGKLLVGGSFLGYVSNGTTYNYNCLALLTSAGELDTSDFAAGGFSAITALTVNAIVVQSATRIVVGGQFSAHSGSSRNNLVGLTATGTLDASFSVGTGFSTIVNSLAVQANGKTVVGGQFTTYNGADTKYIARLDNTGDIDDADTPISGATYAWSPGGATTATLALSPSAGTTTAYTATATLSGVSVTSNEVTITVGAAPITPIAVRVTPAGPTVCAGASQVLTAAAVYPAFSVGTGFNSNVLPLALQPDGKILVGGTFTNYNGTTRNGIARLTTDGGLDGTFLPTGSGLNSGLETLAVQPNGKILVGGYFTTYNGTARSRIARLNADGSLDTTFDPGSGFDGTVFELALQPDGKVVAGGSFNNYNGTARNRIARLNADGSLDTTFDPGTGIATGLINTLAVQPDGKIVVGGGFTSYNGTARNRIARLNADGSLDTTFDPGTGSNKVIFSLILQPDGRVLIAGGFTAYNGTARRRIARLNTNGSLDTSFNSSIGCDSTADGLAIQPNGKILVGGFFNNYNGTARNRVVRINADGSLDTSFTPSTGFDEYVASFAIQPNGKILAGGAFSLFNGVSRNGIARLNTDGSLNDTDTPATGATYAWSPGGATTASITVAPTANTTYTATATLNGASASASTAVTVNPLPVANPGPAVAICLGNTAQIGAAAVPGITYSWTPASGLSNSTVANPVAFPTVTTTYTLTVRNTTTGCTNTGLVTVTVNTRPTALAGTAATICAGGSTQLGGPGTPGFIYNWSPAIGLSSTTTPNPIASPANTTTYFLSVTNALTGCSSAGTVAVTVNPLPVANAGPAATICSGGSAQLGSAAAPNTTYSWSPATGLSSTTVANPTVTLPNTTGGPITQTYVLTATSAGCSSTSTVAVTVNPLPVANTGADAFLCSGGSATLGVAAVAGNTYSWSPATGLSSTTVANPTVTLLNTTGTTITQAYTLTVTSAAGCVSTATATVTVAPLPVANAGSAAAFCSGGSATLGAAAVGGYAYQWSPSIGLSSTTVANPTVTLTNSGTTPITQTYTLLVTGPGNCSSATPGTVTVTVNPLPVANAGVAVATCAGSSIQLGTAAVTGNTYSWTPATGLSSTTVANPTVTLPNTTGTASTTTYTLTVTSAAGCASTSTVAVTVNPAPAANAGAPVAFCAGGSATLGTPAVSGNTYSWSPTTGLSSATAANPTVTLPNLTGAASTSIYTLTVTNATGCVSTATVAVTVNPLPVANAGADATICAGSSAVLGAAAVTNYSYQWSPATGLSNTTVANPTVTLPNATGAVIGQGYTLTVTNTLTGCTTTDAVQVTVNPLPVINGIPSAGPLGGTITINGTGLLGATAVAFIGSAGSTPVNAPVASVNAAGTQLTVVVPATASDGPLAVITPCGTSAPFGRFGVLRILIVSTPNAPTIQGGTYNTIIVTGNGIGTLHTGNVTVTDSIAVLDGGILRLGPFQLQGNGTFRLASGGTLSLGHPGGLASTGGTGNTGGAVDMTGQRRYSLDANYVYTGTASQITGLGLPARVRNLTDSTGTGATLTLSAPTSVAQILTMASATDFNLNSHSLTLLSNATSTALVVNGPAGGRVVGQATMQRATTLSAAHNTATGYRYYSPPVAGATVASLATGGFQPVVNPAYNTSNDPRSVLPAPTVLGYDESRLSAQRLNLPAFDNGLYSPAALTDPLVAGAGYLLTIPATATVSFTGTLTTGNLSPTLSRGAGAAVPNAGWNLVGNPYPAPLNWDSVRVADRPNLDAAMYTYESIGPGTGVYFSYVNGVGDTPIVPAGRSFFVRVSKTASPTGTLLFRNRQRVTRYVADTVVTASHRTAPRLVELRLAQNGVSYKNGGRRDSRPATNLYEDVTADIYRTYRTTASVFNAQLDAYRIPSTTGLDLTISAPVQEDELAIKALSPFTAGQVVPLTVRVPMADGYTLSAAKLQRLPSGLTAFLDDSLLHTSTNLGVQPTYPFAISGPQFAATGGLIKRRFYLRFGPVVLPNRPWAAASDISLYPNPAHDQVAVQIPGQAGATEVQVTLLNQLGQVVRQQTAPLPLSGTLLHLALRNLATGVYAVRLQANGATVVRRLVID